MGADHRLTTRASKKGASLPISAVQHDGTETLCEPRSGIFYSVACGFIVSM